MKKVLILCFTIFSLTSCISFEAVTYANDTVYTDFDAYIAYDVYNELYENGVCDKRPIMIKNNY